MSAQSNAVTPQTAVAPSVPTGVAAQAASQPAKVTWTAPQADGDSPITGYTVTPYIGATAQTPVSAGAVGDERDGHRPDQRHHLHVQGHRHQRASARAPRRPPPNAVTPQATIFDFATPATVDSGDTTSVELGVKFKADYNGTITGIRFYKASTNIGTHIGSLWSSTGTRLAQATFANETASGWQTVTFASPVSVTAGTTYVASYFAPSGHYSAHDQRPRDGRRQPAAARDRQLARAPTASTPTARRARSRAARYNATNYWVDVMYAVPAPGQVTGVTAAEAGQHSADVSWTAPASGGPVTSYKITPYIGSTAQTPTTVTGIAAGDEQDDHRADDRDDVHVHACRPSTPTARARRRRSPTRSPRRRPWCPRRRPA